MLSSSGISWRQGPHQLAQKLIITTWPLYCARLTALPLLEPRVNAGAGEPPGIASAGSATASAAAIATIRFLMMHPSLEEYGRTDARLEVVGELGDADDVRLEDVVLHRDVHSQPVPRHHAVPGTEVHRELRVPAEIGAADAAEEIESARHGDAATDKGLARQEVVAQREVVIREAPLSFRKQRDVPAQHLVAGASGGGASPFALKEEVLGYVIGGGKPVDRMGAEILDRECPVVGPELDVGAADLRHLDRAARHLRLDDARLLALVRRRLVRRIGARRAVMKPVSHRSATGERRQRRQARGQKKNANPAFHSSASSFWLREVKIQWALNSARRKKRRVR